MLKQIKKFANFRFIKKTQKTKLYTQLQINNNYCDKHNCCLQQKFETRCLTLIKTVCLCPILYITILHQ